ncbi:MAG TPA: hypothetical protein VNH18_32665 [Bryobacteraceae bacterium]|nr:hypothetical protein [Bryobacteraceae bacterium]
MIGKSALMALACIALTSLPAQAQTKVSRAIFVSGNVADVWTTCDAFGRGLKEGNPVLGGPHTTCSRIATQSALLNGGLLVLFAIRVKDHPDAKPLASFLLIASGIIHYALALHNVVNGRSARLSASMTLAWGMK